ncbi:MAG: hypothetical protein ACE5D2_05835 [Fidelibacterota bacterium]
MMKIEDIVEDVVLLVLGDHEPLKELGLESNKLYAKVVGYDEYGVWVKHPNFPIPDPDQPPKGKGKPKFKQVTASTLIPWQFIASIVHFPNVEGFDFPNSFDQHIGFDLSDK